MRLICQPWAGTSSICCVRSPESDWRKQLVSVRPKTGGRSFLRRLWNSIPRRLYQVPSKVLQMKNKTEKQNKKQDLKRG